MNLALPNISYVTLTYKKYFWSLIELFFVPDIFGQWDASTQAHVKSEQSF